MNKNGKYLVKRDPKTFEQAAYQIARFIKSEKLPKNSKIPSERKLSELLNISRPSVREGLRVLNLLNYLDSRQGEGTFVTQSPPFLIPENLLDMTIDESIQANYYGIFLMCSEKIALSAINANVSLKGFKKNQSDSQHPFWTDFIALIKDLNNYSKNPYYYQLWQSVYELLENNQFFKQYKSNVTIDDLQIAIIKNDKQQIIKLFEDIVY